jgi:Na+-driven multidrug efflux pump
MGMRPREVLTRVELPIALPLIITGLRVSAVQVVATTTLGRLVGFQLPRHVDLRGESRQARSRAGDAAVDAATESTAPGSGAVSTQGA